MAIRKFVNINITVNSVEELQTVLKELGEDAPEDDPLAAAIEAAKEFQEDFIPFTYDDVGLPYGMRNYRDHFREWALKNNIEFQHVRTPGKRGSQGMMFYPFTIDEHGQKLLAACPGEEVES